MNKFRENFKQLRVNAWQNLNQRQQNKMKATMQLFKVMSMIQEKMRHQKVTAVNKIKEVTIMANSISKGSQDSNSFTRLVKQADEGQLNS